jgi:hypothetical protein
MAAKSGTKSAAGSKSGSRAKSATRASGASSGGTAKSGGRAKTAKTLAGIPIPKSYRDAAGKIAELSRNPLVIEVAAAGLVAAAGAMMRNKSARAAVGRMGGSARDAASETADLAGRIGHAVAAAITNATQRLSSGMGESEDEPTDGGSNEAPAQARQRTAGAAKQRASAASKEGAVPTAKRRGAPIKSKGAMPYVS